MPMPRLVEFVTAPGFPGFDHTPQSDLCNMNIYNTHAVGSVVPAHEYCGAAMAEPCCCRRRMKGDHMASGRELPYGPVFYLPIVLRATS